MFRRKSLGLIAAGLAGLSTSVLLPDTIANAQKPKPVELTLVSYAVTQGAYSKIIPQFAADWKKKTGQDVVFKQSYAGSGTQTRAVIDGLEADIVALALAGDTKKIEEAGLIKPGWEKRAPNNAIVTKSVVAFITRPGKPQIKSWSELADPKIKVITANPKTSGGAKWNFLGLWASVTAKGGTEAQAKTFVDKVYNSVPVLPKDAREATDVFIKQGQGDVLLNYENEAILARQKGAKDPYFVPTDVNISIDNPIAVVDKVVDKRGTRKVAEAFVAYTFTPQAQREYAKVGFRPVNAQVTNEFAKQYPKINKLVTINDFGGWTNIDNKFFKDNGIFDQIIKRK
ncbi:sulfate ABC transporter substrate-binding protein [Geminocystis sp. CENA526]|uniref:sulfate ABC transporter substrate-binding protein n=1 Tax=Geminocystis sp. CENA526 TaxID=1355871 RepID=UPI003D6FBA9F